MLLRSRTPQPGLRTSCLNVKPAHPPGSSSRRLISSSPRRPRSACSSVIALTGSSIWFGSSPMSYSLVLGWKPCFGAIIRPISSVAWLATRSCCCARRCDTSASTECAVSIPMTIGGGGAPRVVSSIGSSSTAATTSWVSVETCKCVYINSRIASGSPLTSLKRVAIRAQIAVSSADGRS